MSEFDAELARARAYRIQQQLRENNRAAEEMRLAGDSERYQELLAKTSPLRSWQGWNPVELVQGDAK